MCAQSKTSLTISSKLKIKPEKVIYVEVHQKAQSWTEYLALPAALYTGAEGGAGVQVAPASDSEGNSELKGAAQC